MGVCVCVHVCPQRRGTRDLHSQRQKAGAGEDGHKDRPDSSRSRRQGEDRALTSQAVRELSLKGDPVQSHLVLPELRRQQGTLRKRQTWRKPLQCWSSNK